MLRNQIGINPSAGEPANATPPVTISPVFSTKPAKSPAMRLDSRAVSPNVNAPKSDRNHSVRRRTGERDAAGDHLAGFFDETSKISSDAAGLKGGIAECECSEIRSESLRPPANRRTRRRR